jgi:hypothetical protein
MPTTWTIAIDWDRNNNCTDTWNDVTYREYGHALARLDRGHSAFGSFTDSDIITVRCFGVTSLAAGSKT